MMARSSKAPSIGRIQKRKTNFSKSSLSACNARPVHTDGPAADVRDQIRQSRVVRPCALWRADRIPGDSVVRDANGQALAYVYSHPTETEVPELLGAKSED